MSRELEYCDSCGKLFLPADASQVECDACRRKREAEMDRALEQPVGARPDADPVESKCVDCGCPIVQVPGPGRPKKRCYECSEIRRKDLEREWRRNRRSAAPPSG